MTALAGNPTGGIKCAQSCGVVSAGIPKTAKHNAIPFELSFLNIQIFGSIDGKSRTHCFGYMTGNGTGLGWNVEFFAPQDLMPSATDGIF